METIDDSCEKRVVSDALLSAIESLDAAVDGWEIDASLPSKGTGVTIKAWKRFEEDEPAVTKYFGSTWQSESRATNIIRAASKIHCFFSDKSPLKPPVT